MREVVVLERCDVDWKEEHTRVDASAAADGRTYQMVVNGKPLNLDLCKPHWQQPRTIEEWQELFAECGWVDTDTPTQPKRPKRTSNGESPKKGQEPYQCPRCSEVRTNRKGLIDHLASQHNMTQAEASQLVPPGGGSETCPICGFLAATNGAGFSMHVRSKHGQKAWDKIQRDRAKAAAS